MKRVSDEEIIEMYQAEPPLTVAQICNELGIHAPQLYTVLAKHNVKPRSANPEYRAGRLSEEAKRSKLTPEELNRREDEIRSVVVDYMLRNKTAVEISAEKGIPYGRVLRVLRDAKVQVIPGRRGRKYDKVRQAIQRDLLESAESGASLAEIAIKYGVPDSTVANIAKRLSEFKQTFRDSQWGKNEALIEEIMHRIREEWSVEVGPNKYQMRLPGM
jgi:transposase-like protein